MLLQERKKSSDKLPLPQTWMNCFPGLHLSPPHSQVTKSLRPLAPGEQLPQYSEWHRQQESTFNYSPGTQASSSSSGLHGPRS